MDICPVLKHIFVLIGIRMMTQQGGAGGLVLLLTVFCSFILYFLSKFSGLETLLSYIFIYSYGKCEPEVDHNYYWNSSWGQHLFLRPIPNQHTRSSIERRFPSLVALVLRESKRFVYELAKAVDSLSLTMFKSEI